MSMLAFFAAQLAALSAGGILLAAFDALRLPLGLLLPTAWLAGTGMLAVERLLVAQAGLPWSAAMLALPWLALAAVGVYRLLRGRARMMLPGLGNLRTR